jgi:hypothetical protein
LLLRRVTSHLPFKRVHRPAVPNRSGEPSAGEGVRLLRLRHDQGADHDAG